MASESPDRMELLKQAQAGNERSLARLLADLRPEVVTYLRGRMDSSPAPGALAEELAQETLVKVAEAIDRCRAESPPQLRGWVRTIARRRAIDRYRRRSAELERRVWAAADELPTAAWAEMVLEPHVASGGPGSADVDRVLGRLVLEAQTALSEGTQIVIRRRLLYGDTWAEAGEVIGTTAGGAKRRWQRARERLRREVEERVAELPPSLEERVRKRLSGCPSRGSTP